METPWKAAVKDWYASLSEKYTTGNPAESTVTYPMRDENRKIADGLNGAVPAWFAVSRFWLCVTSVPATRSPSAIFTVITTLPGVVGTLPTAPATRKYRAGFATEDMTI